MSSSLPDGFDVRFATDQDASAVAELARASEHDVLGLGVIDEGDIRERWRFTDPRSNVWLIHGDGRLAAAATLWLYGDVPIVWGDVRPSSCGRGLGTAPLELAETRARELGAGAVRNDVFARDEAAAALLESRGYRRVRRYYEMRIKLVDEAPPEPEWPESLSVAPFRDGDGPAFHQALGESFRDEWGNPTGATRLYERAGMHVESESVGFEKDLG